MSVQEVQSWVFGRAEDCDVLVNDEYASLHHCRITLISDGSAVVENLGSINGTWVAPPGFDPCPELSTRVRESTPIWPGWTVRIGKTDFPWKAT